MITNWAAIIIASIISSLIGFIIGFWSERAVRNRERKIYQDNINAMEKNYWRLDEQAQEYKKARDEVFKQVTDLLEEKKKIKHIH